jgi:hypothetical protein
LRFRLAIRESAIELFTEVPWLERAHVNTDPGKQPGSVDQMGFVVPAKAGIELSVFLSAF